jgi:hypothetical protein
MFCRKKDFRVRFFDLKRIFSTEKYGKHSNLEDLKLSGHKHGGCSPGVILLCPSTPS